MKNIPYYYTAFAAEFEAVWHSTPFAREAMHMAYLRAVTAFVGTSQLDIEDRRKALYYYADEYKKESKDDTIVRFYTQLPTHSLLRKYVREVCTHYTNAERNFGEDEELNSTFKAFYKNLNTKFQAAHSIAKSCGVCMVRPIVVADELGVRVTAQVFYPDEFRVISDRVDAMRAREVWYAVRNADNTITIYKWTSETVSQYAGNGKLISSEQHNYGILPFVFLRTDYSEDFYGSPMFELAEQSLLLNKVKFQANLSISFTSSPVWIATNMGLKELSFSPDKIHAIENVSGDDVPPQLDAISPDARFAELDEVVNQRERKAYADAGLPSSAFADNTQIQSGISRYIERLPLLEQRENDAKFLRDFEQDFFTALKEVLRADANYFTPESAVVSVEFPTEQILLESKDEYELDKQKTLDGVMSALEFYNKYSAQKVESEEEALQKLRILQAPPTDAQAISNTPSEGVANAV